MMNVFALAANSDLGAAFSLERWSYAGKMTLLGMVMVFAVLGLLWVVLAIFKYVMVGKTETPAATPPAQKERTNEAPAVVEEAPVVAPATDDAALIAVIAAAVAAYRADEEGMDAESAGSFRVVSFRRASGGRAWNSGR